MLLELRHYVGFLRLTGSSDIPEIRIGWKESDLFKVWPQGNDRVHIWELLSVVIGIKTEATIQVYKQKP